MDRGGVESKPLSMIFAILTHCLGATDINNYSLSAKGRWFFEDTCLEWTSPLSPLKDWEGCRIGPNSRNAGETFRKRAIDLCAHWSWRRWGLDRRLGVRRQVAKNCAPWAICRDFHWGGGFETVDLLSVSVKPDGSAVDLSNHLPPEFELKSEISDTAILRRRSELLASIIGSRNKWSVITKIGPSRNTSMIVA